MFTIKLKEKVQARVLNRHPWVYVDEVSEHIKSVQPGFPVRLVDDKNRFVAYGIGNPQSQLAIRVWSFNEQDHDFFNQEFVIKKIKQAWEWRIQAGFQASFRVLFSEGDGLSGLTIDRYFITYDKQIIVYQLGSGAYDVLIPDFKAFTTQWLTALGWVGETSTIVKRSATYQKIENLKPQTFELLSGDEAELGHQAVVTSRWPYLGLSTQVSLVSDFIKGQKTGLFLDQNFNIGLICHWAQKLFAHRAEIKILDLCCYRGAWSTHLAQALSQVGVKVQVTLLDQSAEALKQAQLNVSQFASQVEMIQGDVMQALDQITNTFDLIISDPPAFAKNKKAAGAAREGYYHLNRKVVNCLNEQGLLVACSCTSVVTEGEFAQVLERVARVTPQFEWRHLVTGGHGPDHPVKPQFREGHYLKMMAYWLEKK